jgi:hypothetical protein
VFVFTALAVFTLMVIFGVYYRRKMQRTLQGTPEGEIQKAQGEPQAQTEEEINENPQSEGATYEVQKYLYRQVPLVTYIQGSSGKGEVFETVLEVEETTSTSKKYYRETFEYKDSSIKLYEKIIYIDTQNLRTTHNQQERGYFIKNVKSDLMLLKLETKSTDNVEIRHLNEKKEFSIHINGKQIEVPLIYLKEVTLPMHKIKLCPSANDKYVVTEADLISDNGNDTIQIGTSVKFISSDNYEIITGSNDGTCQNKEDEKIEVVLKENGNLTSLSKTPSTFSFFYDDKSKNLNWSDGKRKRKNIPS